MLRDRTILFQGASKAFAMTGWRVGVLAADAKWMKTLFLAHQQLVTTGVTVSNRAARRRSATARRMSKRCVPNMKKKHPRSRFAGTGFEVPALKGAFYAFAKIPAKFGTDDKAFCREIGMNAKVRRDASLNSRTRRRRLCPHELCVSTDMVAEAAERLKTYIASK